MRRAAVVAVLLLVSPLMAGCGGPGATCADVPDLQDQLARTSPSDPDYNDLVVKLKQARADCNN